MEQLIILLLIGLGSLISTYIQNRNKRLAEEREAQMSGDTSSRGGEPPVPSWPRSARDWQEEMRRILQGEMAPPQSPPPPKLEPSRVPPPVRATLVLPPTEKAEGDLSLPSPLKQSASAYSRAAQLSGRVESRLQSVDPQAVAHRPAPAQLRLRPAGGVVLRRWTQNRQNLREAFIASLIFSPPVGFDQERFGGRSGSL